MHVFLVEIIGLLKTVPVDFVPAARGERGVSELVGYDVFGSAVWPSTEYKAEALPPEGALFSSSNEKSAMRGCMIAARARNKHCDNASTGFPASPRSNPAVLAITASPVDWLPVPWHFSTEREEEGHDVRYHHFM